MEARLILQKLYHFEECMDIEIFLKSGLGIKFEKCTEIDYEKVVQEMTKRGNFFTWNDAHLFRKTEIAYIRLVRTPVNAEDIQEMEREEKLERLNGWGK